MVRFAFLAGLTHLAREFIRRSMRKDIIASFILKLAKERRIQLCIEIFDKKYDYITKVARNVCMQNILTDVDHKRELTKGYTIKKKLNLRTVIG